MKRKLLFSFLTALFAIPVVNVSAEEFKLDLSTATYASASEEEVVWKADAFTMVAEKAGATTKANNYLGGSVNSDNGKTITSSRFYAHSNLTITPAAGYEIETIAFECTTDNYATNLANSSWPNATAAKSGTTVTITAIDGTKAVSAAIGGTTGATSMTVVYHKSGEAFVAAPTISPASGTYTEPQTVTITVESGLTAYYETGNGTYVKYTTPFTVSETTTVTAYAEDASGLKSSFVSCEIKIVDAGDVVGNGTASNPYNVASAISLITNGLAPSTDVYVKGIISEIKEVDETGQFGNATYFISDDGTTTTQLQVYRGYYLNKEQFESASQIKVGDEVVVCGKLIYFQNETPEFNSGNYIYSLNGEGGGSVEPVEEKEYKTIADAKAAATTAHVNAKLNFSNVLVTYVNGSSVYVTDGTEGFLIFGKVNVAAGQRVNITVNGELYLYNGLPELSVAQTEGAATVELISEGNEVTPTTVGVAELKNNAMKYSSLLVKVENVWMDTEAWDNRNVTIIAEDGTEAVVRDNWKVATDMTFRLETDYNVTGFVAIYNDAVQIYPRTADDIEIITNLTKPESAWSVEAFTAKTLSDAVPTFSTNSNGAVTYASSDESVAMVDANGVITLVGPGNCTITATTAETSTYLESVTTLPVKVAILEGEGTEEKPYTFFDAEILYVDGEATEKVWVEGIIYGCANGNFSKIATSAEDETNLVESNILISPVAVPAGAPARVKTEGGIYYMPVALPFVKDGDNSVREKVNLKSNPENFGKRVIVHGTIEKYFSVCGIKNVDDVILDGEHVITGINGVNVDAAAAKEIYTIAGQKVSTMTRGLYIVNGKKVFVK